MKFSQQVLLAALNEIDALTDALVKANARIKELEDKYVAKKAEK